ncbi:MAG: cyclodeaminase/cyclohydrolase family protein [Clostridium sp.]|jgi:formiminotetrahydrofolate cyclodeaminase|uniref:cyclodeaminase/cyclohydrolase family protein n=1 Tax=Clostridium sp. TaxID=1506 RepID=UPI0025BBAEA9|nr:cyclodeaminase/cyclohydrolase family protein [Clostridium sp.]MCH3966005.1 cyclodeaminase/cyclohydrolase family protein [Clostridium sp.]MCI1715907.1 cyclodeaminase/cyclohydrolase family protein [Clostridium sp.]MCI1800421.1 cyclodeaminase/cyclohydrolase family protein [Clostridium sp.]MCI1814084.1 cyclodeaminase/cyclohydrolase family protein [Clostridium sp.]MCI1870982.1 cyclodeaminase/cyclohydrolase family protein [Clostridium sp.]
MKIVDNPCRDFLEELSSKSAVPGGGGAAAMDGAMGAALLSMVCSLTLGKKKYREYAEKLESVLESAGKLTKEFLDMVDEDAENFIPLSKAYGIPCSNEEEKIKKEKIMDKCLKSACIVPVKVIKRSYDTILLHSSIVGSCSELVLSDIGVGVQCLKAAMSSAYLNVIINIKFIKDREYVAKIEDEVKSLLKDGAKIADDVYENVVKKLSE